MNNKMIIAATAGGLAAFLLGWLVFGVVMTDFYSENSIHYEGLQKKPPQVLYIFFANLCWGALLAYLFNKIGTRTFVEGCIQGIIIGFFIALSYDLLFHATLNLYNSTLLIADVIVNTLFAGIMAGIVAVVLGSGNKQTA